MTDDQLTHAQHEVQRLLGRNLLRLQQFERDLKMLYTHFSLSASLGQDVTALRKKRHESVAKSTLGQVAETLMKEFMVSEDASSDNNAAPNAHESFSVTLRHGISMSAEQRTRMLTEMDELIAMRNHLVHDFIAEYDLISLESCMKAETYLHTCYKHISTRHNELRGWLKGLTAKIELLRQLFESPAIHNLFVKGIVPQDQQLTLIEDGRPIEFQFIANDIKRNDHSHWSGTDIVRELHKAARHLAGQDGWTSLEQARLWLAQHAPGENPEKYGCHSWKQLVHESGAFELQHRRDSTGVGSRWFRGKQN